jgi:hypothetical protein
MDESVSTRHVPLNEGRLQQLQDAVVRLACDDVDIEASSWTDGLPDALV